MGVDFHKVCKCGSYHSEYICRTGMRHCRNCGSLLSVHGVFQEASPCFGMTDEQVKEYFRTGIDPRTNGNIQQQVRPDKSRKCDFPKAFIVCTWFNAGLCKSPDGICRST